MGSQRRVACVLLWGSRLAEGTSAPGPSEWVGMVPGVSPAANPVTALAEACYRFSPEIALRGNEAIFLEVGKCRTLYTEESLALRLAALARRFGFQCRVAVADTAPTALAMARHPAYQRTKNLRDLPLEAFPDLLSPFRADEELARETRSMIESLERLGVRSAGEFAALPAKTLASRFGKRALSLMSIVWGDLEPAWPGFHPSPRILERATGMDEGAEGGLESILFVLRKLVDRAMARLRGKGERASQVEIELDLEKWSSSRQASRRTWRLELPVPQGSAAGLVPILRERMQFDLAREPLRAPVQGMRFEVLESVPGAGAQRDFFNRSEEESEAWEALVGRLAQKLGKDNVFVAEEADRWRPERAYQKVSPGLNAALALAARADEGEDGDVPRPARVLRRPEPLERDGRVLRSLSGKQWRVLSWSGPERLDGEWWDEIHRAAEAEQGAGAALLSPHLAGASAIAKKAASVVCYGGTPNAARAEGKVESKAGDDPWSAPEEFHRDYYRVVTEGGEQLWVFLNRRSKTPSFYLHGYFD